MDIQIEVEIFLGEQIEKELEKQIFNLQRRVLRDGSNPLQIPETLFQGLYRLPKRLAKELVNDLEPFLNDPVLCAFYGHGSYEKSIGQDYILALTQAVVTFV